MEASTTWKDQNICPICLEPLHQEAYLDQCFHTFCYPCIIYWSNVLKKKSPVHLSSVKCPLCKTDNHSIIHNFDGEHFQRHYLTQTHRHSFLSAAHDFRLHCYNNNIRLSSCTSDIQLYWKQHKYLRKNVWFESWLKREIQALMEEEDVDIIFHHIKGAIDNFVSREQREGASKKLAEEKRKEFRGLVLNAGNPFLLGRIERFVDEVELFLVLGFTIKAYDELYMQITAGSSSSA